ncbi:hypothetical protein [Paenibacillus faecalis]|uniref:hypothetical protein n=1 Tax=Paenibacillus faecalis TaxID=2079532 RepID=UPI000D0F2087|nr:hypothetical protein [Paenibacillus faecalis]
MKVLKISYPTSLSKISNKENDNIDVFVELEDGSHITVVVSTPLNLLEQMNKDNINYTPAPQPEIIVRSLTEENITKAIEDYAREDAFWLKLLYAASVDKDAIDMDRIQSHLIEIKRSND